MELYQARASEAGSKIRERILQAVTGEIRWGRAAVTMGISNRGPDQSYASFPNDRAEHY
jgi:hypothetical protein